MQPADGFCRRPVSPAALTEIDALDRLGDFAACVSFRAPGLALPAPCARTVVACINDRDLALLSGEIVETAVSQRTDQRVLAGHAITESQVLNARL
jgi:hypothetical protein